MKGLISVIIPTYNSEKYLNETISSVLKQSYRNFELIIVDDGSEDNTREIIEGYASQNNQIKFFRIPHSGNPSVPRNFGISKANGEFIAFLDNDDLWTKNKLKIQLKYLQSRADIVLAYSMSVTFGDVNIFSPYFEVLPLFHKAAKTKNDLIVKGNSITCSSVIARTDLIKKTGGFDEDPELKVEDYDLWLRLAELGDFCFIPKILTYYRVHSSQFSNSWQIKQQRLEYLAQKRNLQLPAYKFYRNRGIIFLIIRNTVHTLYYLLFSALSLFCLNTKKK
jgi:glycosyltransferase involved in cell wall biosynthesis